MSRDPFRRDRRRGFWSIDTRTLDDEFGADGLLLMQREVVIMQLDREWARDCTTWAGYAPFFAEVPEGDVIPSYDVVAIRENNRLVAVEWRWGDHAIHVTRAEPVFTILAGADDSVTIDFTGKQHAGTPAPASR